MNNIIIVLYIYKAATMKATLDTLIYIDEFLLPYTCTEEE